MSTKDGGKKLRFFVILLALVFLLSLPLPLFAQEETLETDTRFTVASGQGQAGDRVWIPVFIEACAPFFAIGLRVHYDRTAMLLSSIQFHEDSRPKHMVSLDRHEDISTGLMLLVYSGAGNVRFEDGPFLLLGFDLLEQAQSGAYEIGLSLSQADWVNWEEQMLEGTFVPGILEVEGIAAPNHYMVTFEGGEDATGTSPSLSDKMEGEAFSLPENSFQKEGFSFVGWHDGVSLYDAGDSYTMPGHAVTFTAHWKEDIPSGHEEPDVQPLIDPKDVADRDLTVEVTEGGIIVGGKDLSGLSFDVNTPGGKVRVDLDTEEKEVLIKDRGKEGLEVFIDADGDGVFETSIGRFALKGNRVFLIVVLIVLGLSACLIGFLIYRRRRERA